MMLEFNKKNEMIHPTTITVLVKTSRVHEQNYVQAFPSSELSWTEFSIISDKNKIKINT